MLKFLLMQGQDSTMFAVSLLPGPDQAPDYAAAGMQIAEKVQGYPPTWYFIYLIILVGLFAWIRLYYGNLLLQTIQASTNVQVANKIFNNNSQLKNQLDLVLFLFYFLSMAFLLYYVELRTGLLPYGFQGARLFMFNLALLPALFSGRLLLHSIVGALFNSGRIVREYLYNMFIYNKISGIAALPLMFLLVYTRGGLQDVVFWISVFVLAGIVVMRVIRGLVFSYRKEVLNIYILLYLCALEIIPLVLLYRWLEGIL